MTARRLLVATYYYPPQPGSGAYRWAAMVKYLRRLGHDVTVLTAAPPGREPGTEDGIVRTSNLNSSPALRRLLLRTPRAAAHDAHARDVTRAGVGELPPALWRLVVPDPWLLTWNPYARRALGRLLAGARFDCVITSSPAASTHLLGLAPNRRRGLPWIADFRDGWGFEPLLAPFPTPPQRALDRWLERRVATGADIVTAATAPIAEDFRSRLGVSAELVTNGWDPDLESDRGGTRAPPKDREPLTLVHTGALSGAWGRDPRALFAALRRLVDADPTVAQRLEVVLAGRTDAADAELLREAALGAMVRHVGYLPRDEALALQRGAGALLLVTSPNRGEATGKLFEYLAARRPIIALAEGNEAARIVRETNAGVAVAPDDVDAIAGVLRSALSGELERACAPRGLEQYTYPAPAERIAALIESLSARPRSG